MKRHWLNSTTKRSGNGWRCTYEDQSGPIVSVWSADPGRAQMDAQRHLERYATPKEAGQ